MDELVDHHRRASELLTALEHEACPAGTREVRGGGETVVAAADDHDVVAVGGRAHRKGSIAPRTTGARRMRN